MLKRSWDTRSLGVLVPTLAGWFLCAGPSAVAQTILFQETFDSDLGASVVTNDGVASNSWHFRNDCDANPEAGHSAPGAARWGNPTNCVNYGTDPVMSTDRLETPTIDISSCSTQLLISFNYILEFEEDPPFDIAAVEISVDGGSAILIADNGGLSGELLNGEGWTPFSLDLADVAGPGNQLKITFTASVRDETFNSDQGFLIDDVTVACMQSAVDLSIEKVDDVDPVAPGGDLNYLITVTNQAVVDYEVKNSRDDGVPMFDFDDISGSGTPLVLGDDQVSAAIALGFDFVYFGTTISEVFVSSNGFLTVLPGQSDGCCEGGRMPLPGDPDGVIAAWWTDLDPTTSGTIHHQKMGIAPNREFVVEFKDVSHFFGPPVSFDIKLFEGSNNIEIHYREALPDEVSLHTVGIEDSTGLQGVQFYRGSVVPDGQEFEDFAVRFTPQSTSLAATGVVVTDVLPAEVSAVDADASQGSCVIDAGLGKIACDLGDLAAAATATVDVEATVAADLKTAFVNVASVSSDQQDVNSVNNLALELTAPMVDVDLAISQTESIDPVLASTGLTYTVTLANQSAEEEATRVTVIDTLTLPAGVSLLSAAATAGDLNLSGTVVTWTIERLPAGSSQSLALALEVEAVTAQGSVIENQAAIITADQTLINVADDATVETTEVEVPVDLVIGKTGAPDPVVAGSVATYTLTVANPSLTDEVLFTVENSRDDGIPVFNFEDVSGSGTAVALADDQVSDAIPLGFEFEFYGNTVSQVYVSSNGFLTSVAAPEFNGCCAGSEIPRLELPNGLIAGWWSDLNPAAGGAIHYQTLGTAPNRRFILQFKDVPHLSGPAVSFEFKLFEGSETIEIHYLDAPSDDMKLHTVGIENPAGTEGAEFFHGITVPPGEEFQNFAVRFAGTQQLVGSDASGVTVTDVLPEEVTFISAMSTQGSCGEAGGTVTCDLGALALGDDAEISIDVMISPVAVGEISNTASVVVAETERNPSDNTATATIDTISISADLAITVADMGAVAPGDQLTTAVTVTNLGPAVAAGGQIVDALPPPLTFVSSTEGCTGDADTVTCAFETVAAGATASRQFVLAVDPLAPLGPATQVATVISSTVDPDLDNNTVTAVVEIVDPADLIIFADGFESGDTSNWSQTVGSLSRPADASADPPPSEEVAALPRLPFFGVFDPSGSEIRATTRILVCKGAGENCATPGDCCSNVCCNSRCKIGSCPSCKPKGATCSRFSICCSGLTCTDAGICG